MRDVVVGQADDVEAGFRGVLHELRGRVGAVGFQGVRVRIDECHFSSIFYDIARRVLVRILAQIRLGS